MPATTVQTNGVRGFTLIELMIAILIFAILAAIGIPSWRDAIQNNRVTGATNDLVTALNLARSEAVRRGTPVAVCAVNDPNAIPPLSCNTTTTWTSGWMVFTDNFGVVGVRDGGDTVLQSWPGLGSSMVANSSLAFTRYDVTGMLSSAAVTFQVWTNNCKGNKRGNTTVSVVGSIRSTKTACP